MAKIHHADLWGLRQGKYQTLSQTDITTTDWAELQPNSPFYLFVPLCEDLLVEYEKGWKVTDIFPLFRLGMNSHRDNFVVGLQTIELEDRILNFLRQDFSDDDIRSAYGLEDNRDWKLSSARGALRTLQDWRTKIIRCLYRPFDFRYILYGPWLIDYHRPEVNEHMLKPNLSLLTTRQTKEPFAALATNLVCGQHKIVTPYDGTYVLPLYLYPQEQPKEAKSEPKTMKEAKHLRTQLAEKRPHREANLNPEFIKAVSKNLGLKFVADGKGYLKQTFGPEDIFNYAYAVFHSPTYRSRYAEFLKIDFPRLPLTSDKELFKALAEKGAELVALHLMASPALNSLITRYPISGSNLVEKVTYSEPDQRVYINKSQYFEGIPQEVWNFQVGGYQVCQKWLKDRKGRMLSYDEMTHYQNIVVALKETIRLMQEIDALIPGWPLE